MQDSLLSIVELVMQQQRSLVVVEATSQQQQAIQQLLQQHDKQLLCSYVDLAQKQQQRLWLGREQRLVVANAMNGMHPNLLAAIAGTIVGGGVLLLFIMDAEQWCSGADPFYQTMRPYGCKQAATNRFRQRIIAIWKHRAIWLAAESLLQQDTLQRLLTAVAESSNWQKETTTEQQQLIAAIIDVATGDSKRPLLISADRGRGKSAALGIAAATLLQTATALRRIAVVASQPSMVWAVLYHCSQLLDGSVCDATSVQWQDKSLQFYGLDQLDTISADLLLVDEAGAIATDYLQQLLLAQQRAVFATTIDGYEGSGRGFLLRFLPMVQQHYPMMQHISLQQPIRWLADDPLENIMCQSLLPASDSTLQRITVQDDTDVYFTSIDRDSLLQDETVLQQIYGVLFLAHYQTSPMDLLHLLDAPTMQIFVAKNRQQQVVAVLLAETEGELDSEIIASISDFRRRPYGHKLPQTLIATYALQQLGLWRWMRIIRIAVVPQLQHQGIGSALLQYVQTVAQRQGCNALGSLFSLHFDIVRFWQKQQWNMVYLSMQANRASGCYSTLYMQLLTHTTAEIELEQQLQQLFQQQWWLRLQQPHMWQRFSYCLIQQIAVGLGGVKPSFDQRERELLRGFSNGHRPLYSVVECLYALSIYLLQHQFLETYCDNETQQHLLIAAIIQRKSDQQISTEFAVPVKHYIQQLRTIFAKVLSDTTTIFT